MTIHVVLFEIRSLLRIHLTTNRFAKQDERWDEDFPEIAQELILQVEALQEKMQPYFQRANEEIKDEGKAQLDEDGWWEPCMQLIASFTEIFVNTFGFAFHPTYLLSPPSRSISSPAHIL